MFFLRIKNLCSLLTDFSLVDVWRKQNPSQISFTWFNSDFTQASRIDWFLIARALVSKVFSCEFLPCALLDHDFVHLGLSLDGSTKHSGIWKFNNSLLADPEFKTVLSEVIAIFKLQIPNFNSLRAWWDSLKLHIRDTCIRFSACKHKS